MRKRKTSFVSSDTAESFLFSLCFWRSLYLRKDLNPSCNRRKIDSFGLDQDSKSKLLIFIPITDGLGIMIMATYETFAAVYDAVMDDSLYDLWTDFSLRHLPKTMDKKKLLELACGTGIQSVRFSQAGFDVTGLDLSADMLKIAQKRASSAKQKIDFIEGNMLDLSQAGKYDFVTCYSDSICYMQDEVEVGDVFKEVYNALNEDGVFIFDVHSTYQTDEVFPGYSYHENAEDFAMLWDTYEDAAPHSIVHELTFFLQEEDGSFSRHDEVHEERTYEVLTYDVLLEQAGFKSFKLYADFEDKEPTETSARWFFVAQK